MSHISWSTRHAEVRVSGIERFHMAALVDEACRPLVTATAVAALGPAFAQKCMTAMGRDLLHGDWMGTSRDWLNLTFRSGSRDEAIFSWNGRPLDNFSLSLNTMLASATTDAQRLCARLHGQCELHAWVDGPDRAWMAQIIEDGLAAGTFRAIHPGDDVTDNRWHEAITLLRESNRGAVVTAFSVTDSFNWRLLPKLRANTGGLQMNPDDWCSFRFGHNVSLVDLFVDNRDDLIPTIIADSYLLP